MSNNPNGSGTGQAGGSDSMPGGRRSGYPLPPSYHSRSTSNPVSIPTVSTSPTSLLPSPPSASSTSPASAPPSAVATAPPQHGRSASASDVRRHTRSATPPVPIPELLLTPPTVPHRPRSATSGPLLDSGRYFLPTPTISPPVGGESMARARSASSSPRGPPSYARSTIDRSPGLNPMSLDDRSGSTGVPPPIYLRSSSPQAGSKHGSLKIHIPAWGIVIVKPPRKLELHPLETGAPEPPVEDTVLSGSLEVIMKERRRAQAISVGVQSVCRLHMGETRGWEEDGVFERGVEVLGGDAEGIWLEKGSQTFTFTILLPATLATHDHHQFCRISYILTARVEGIPHTGGITSLFKKSPQPQEAMFDDIPFKEDFQAVIARSDKLAADLSLSRQHSRESLPAAMNSLGLSSSPPDDSSAIAIGEGSPTLNGLYHRRQSHDIQRTPGGGHSPLAPMSTLDDRASVLSFADSGQRTEKGGWLKGDLTATRSLIVHANPSPTGTVNDLDIRKEGFVDGLGSWKISVTTDVFCISAVCLLSIQFPFPSPLCTIFFVRLLLVQSYAITSPRTPNMPPHKPENPKNHVLYTGGTPHKPGQKCLPHDQEALWRGIDAGGVNVEEGWKARAMMRIPNHDKIRPSTHEGTITPIRVSHEFLLQVFYSLEGETVQGKPILGPGELRMMQVKIPVSVPSCCCTRSTLNLPTYDQDESTSPLDIDSIISGPPGKQQCMCGSTFAELGEAAMKRLQNAEQEDLNARIRAAEGENDPPPAPDKALESGALGMERSASAPGSRRGSGPSGAGGGGGMV